MRLKTLKLNNFRNYEDIELELSPNINIFIGDNGAGKTNILESIYVLSLTKSSRYGNDEDLINHNFNNLRIEGIVAYDDYLKKYQIDIDKFSKRVYINNQEIKKISSYISNFCVVAFLPNDIEIIKGSPSIRRNLLNIQIGQLYNNYIKHVNEYNSVLRMRNEYLKTININGNSDSKYLDIITDKLISIAGKIYYFRFLYMKEVNLMIASIYKRLSGFDNLRIEYVNNIGIFEYDEEQIRKKMYHKFKKNIYKETMQGMTLIGPHRDDFTFKIGEDDAKTFASQGQQRLMVIAYKIVELKIFKKIKKDYPVLLLDDVFSEIDIKKRNKIVKFLNEDIQTIVTTTDLENIEKKLVENAKICRIKAGKIIKGGIKNGRKSTRKL